jgi:hypothetical protein
MAKRGLAIGRIIEHLRTCDIEELEYLGHRAAQIHSERTETPRTHGGLSKKSHKRKQSLTQQFVEDAKEVASA